MAHFSNATEYEFYESNICERCIHYDKPDEDPYICPVMSIHFCYQDKIDRNVLNMLIPVDENGHNSTCKMFKAVIEKYCVFT